MTSRAPNFSVPKIAFGETKEDTLMPDMTDVTLDCSVQTPRKFKRKSSNAPLSGTYTVAAVSLGMDLVNDGYTVSLSTAISDPQVVTSGEGIRVRIAQPWNAFSDFKYAAATAIFIQKGTDDYRCAKFGYVDPAVDFSTMVLTEPLDSVQTISDTDLTTLVTSDHYGSRRAYGIDWAYQVPTTGGVRLRHIPTNLTISQDDITDFDVVTARATQLETAVLSTAMPLLASNIGANYLEFDDSDSTIVKEVEQDLYAIVNNVRENTPIKVLYGNNIKGVAKKSVHLGNLIINNRETVEDYNKSSQFRIEIVCAPAGFDTLLDGLHTGIGFEKDAA